MKINKKLQFNLFIVFFIILLILPTVFFFKAKPSEAENSYPKLANYFLKWKISESEARELAQWDLLVLDMENQENNPEMLRRIRTYNPDIKILAYITSQEIIDYGNGWFNQEASLREELYKQIPDSWWLKDSNNNNLSFWQGTHMLNVSDGCGISSRGERWNDFLPRFVSENILSTNLWDGVFYDNVWGDITWLDSDIEIKTDSNLSDREINNYWNKGTTEILSKTRELNPDSIILGNGRVFLNYQQYLNGMMLEDFPSSWENGGTWAGSIETYNNLRKYNKEPQSSIVLRFGNFEDYKSFRFGLTSSLLNNGYFGYNLSQGNQGQLWWFDEYNVNLGQAESSAYNLLDSSENIKTGLWRRDFENGISITNSTNGEQIYSFEQEEFQKISGSQDPKINNGLIVNSVSLDAKDGLLLLKRNTNIIDSVFDNGSFNRVFNINGEQTKSGFFSYKNNYPSNSQIIVSDIDNDGNLETLVNYKGEIKIYRGDQLIENFIPFVQGFKGEISVTIADLNGDGTKEIITGAGAGGGPHVRVFSKDGKPLIGGFFAYDECFRGGVNVAVLDLNGDGTKEIITGAGAGGGPHVRVFSKDGKPLIGGFFAYDREFTGGVSVAVGDVNNDGQGEIVVSPGLGGSPRVKIYNKEGELINSFLAYDNSFLKGIEVGVADLDNDNSQEILVSTFNF